MFPQIPVLKDAENSFHLSASRVKGPLSHNLASQCLMFLSYREQDRTVQPDLQKLLRVRPSCGRSRQAFGSREASLPRTSHEAAMNNASLLVLPSHLTFGQLGGKCHLQFSTPSRFGRRKKLKIMKGH